MLPKQGSSNAKCRDPTVEGQPCAVYTRWPRCHAQGAAAGQESCLRCVCLCRRHSSHTSHTNPGSSTVAGHQRGALSGQAHIAELCMDRPGPPACHPRLHRCGHSQQLPGSAQHVLRAERPSRAEVAASHSSPKARDARGRQHLTPLQDRDLLACLACTTVSRPDAPWACLGPLQMSMGGSSNWPTYPSSRLLDQTRSTRRGPIAGWTSGY